MIDKDGFILRPENGRPVHAAGGRRNPRIGGPGRPARTSPARACDACCSWRAQADHISEVDAADPNNLVVAEHIDDRVLTLMMGDENYSSRMSNFLNNYNEIRMKRPDSTNFDLRVDNLITVVGAPKNVK